MLVSKINAMSIGPIWLSRVREQFIRHPQRATSESVCSCCGEPWLLQSSDEGIQREDANVAAQCALIVLAEPITNEAQQQLLENCLFAAGWYAGSACFSLHLPCSSNMQSALSALQEQINTQAPDVIIVFGSNTAQLMHPEFVQGRINHFENIRLMVTYHPEEMLNNPSLKAQVWADFCLAKME